MTLSEWNSLPQKDAEIEITRCCASQSWVRHITQARPFDSIENLKRKSNEIMGSLTDADWLEAFSGHPKIGDIGSLKKKYANTKGWSSSEQAGVSESSDATLYRLQELNLNYESKFGFIFIICATGKSASEMLSALEARLSNSREDELKTAAREQSKITDLRLEKLL